MEGKLPYIYNVFVDFENLLPRLTTQNIHKYKNQSIVYSLYIQMNKKATRGQPCMLHMPTPSATLMPVGGKFHLLR